MSFANGKTFWGREQDSSMGAELDKQDCIRWAQEDPNVDVMARADDS